MAIIIKSKEEREKIRETGRIVAEILAELRDAVHPGMTTGEIDKMCAAALQRRGAKSSSLGYRGYPASLCTSVNEEIVHGIPGQRVLKEGDIVSIDFAASYKGWHADSAITVPVGKVAPDVERLLQVTEEALYRGIAVARAGNRLQDIGRTVQKFVEAAGFSVVRLYGGHGVGRSMHEDPQVLNYVEPGYPNYVLKPGMVLAIEPMVIMGKKDTLVLPDEWTVVTADGTYAAHFEHTVAITEGDADILTLPGS
ncbi:MAG TPA: type I methionyl aminopeptidase [Ktedonobacteraceae bacterium]|jgi:methionyl aminopeptidase|nr:type I methionyl aminopeptidase [Ktedonobacteraceae bacterium]